MTPRSQAAPLAAPSRWPGARRRLTAVALVAITVPMGLVWRFGPWHLAPFAYKYGGSALWAIGVYWLLAALVPRMGPVTVAMAAATVSVAVEAFKLFRNPMIDRFRATLPGKVLIGRYFTFGAIAAYLLAIICMALCDAWLIWGRGHERHGG